MIRIIVIGYGSIGKRHVRLLEEKGHDVGVVSRRDVNVQKHYWNLEDAIEKQDPHFIVVANRTSEHSKTLYELTRLSFTGTALVEKPLVHSVDAIPTSASYDIRVAYNFRFHPLLQELRRRVQNQEVVSVDAYAGQYLPSWRPERDYRQTYSARKSQGGGVLRDLSHEIDYLLWLLGDWKRVAAIGGKFSDLEIDSDDVFMLLMETSRCPAIVLQLNYLDREVHRTVRINTLSHTLELDLVASTLSINGTVIRNEEVGRDTTYLAQHDALLNNNSEELSTLEDGNRVVRLVEAAEQSAELGTWIPNKYVN